MVLSNYKYMHIRIQNSEISIQGLQTYSSNVSSNRIKIQVILLILQLETDYFSKLFISESAPFEAVTLQSSQRLPGLLFYTKKPCKILQLQFQLQFYMCTLHYNPENSPSRIQFYIQKTKSSSSTATTFQRAERPSFQKRNSTHKRQGDLLEILPCDITVSPVIPDTPETFRTFQSFMTFQPFQAILQILQCSSISRESTPFQHSLIRMHILHILQFDWFPQKTPPSTSWAITNITVRTFILQRKGDVAISVKLTYSPE